MDAGNSINWSDHLIRSVYGTLGRRDLWPSVLEEICRAFDGSGVMLVEHNFGNRIGFNRYRCHHVSDVIDKSYNTRMCGRNLWLHSDLHYQPETAFLGSEVLPNSELVKSDFYREHLRPAGWHYRLCGVVDRKGLQVQFVSIMRSKDDKPFSKRDKAALRRVLPHLHLAWDLRKRLRADRSEHESLLDVLDHVPVACLLVNQVARLQFRNKAAEHLLARRDGLLATAGYLSAGTHRESERLRRVIAKVAAYRSPRPEEFGEHIVISRPSERVPLLLTCFSVSRSEIDRPGEPDALVALLIKDPDGENLDNFDGFTDAYHLTPAEARLVGLLAEGRGLFQAAQELRITKNTVRTHMRHIYSKVGAHRQADIIRLLAKLGMS